MSNGFGERTARSLASDCLPIADGNFFASEFSKSRVQACGTCARDVRGFDPSIGLGSISTKKSGRATLLRSRESVARCSSAGASPSHIVSPVFDPSSRCELLGDLRFQVADPVFVGDVGIDIRGEKVDMVGHDHVAAHEPRRCLFGNVAKDAVEHVAGENWHADFQAERVEDDGGLPTDLFDAVSRVSAFWLSNCGSIRANAIREGDAPAEPWIGTGFRLGRSLALPHVARSVWFRVSHIREGQRGKSSISQP